jgi:hypothetical protein
MDVTPLNFGIAKGNAAWRKSYIVGRSLQSHYEHRPWFATTALFELKMPQ